MSILPSSLSDDEPLVVSPRAACRLARARAPGSDAMTEQSEIVRQEGEWATEDPRDQRQSSHRRTGRSAGQQRRFELFRFGAIKLANPCRYIVRNLIPRDGLV